MLKQQSVSRGHYSNSMFGVICAIACLASSTRAQLKCNQSRGGSWDNVRNYLTRGDFSDIDLVNLMRVLDLVSNSEEFQPLKISIGTFGANPDLSGRISKFFERKLITSYQVDLRNDLSSSPIANFVEITWIILVENHQVLNFDCKWSKLLWNSRNKYIILFLQRENSEPQYYKEILSTHWKRDGVSKILIGSAEDHFQYFYRYLPFETNSHGFGRVERIFIDQRNIEIFLENCRRGIKMTDFSTHETRSLKELKTIFVDFMNLNNYPIDVTIFKSQMVNISKIGNSTIFSGLDVNAMIFLKNVLNADFRIDALTRNYKLDPFEIGLRKIDSGKADLIMTTYFVKSYEEFKSFDFTVGVHFDKLCLFGKAAGKVPKSFMPFLPISLDFWPLFIIYNIFISVFWIKFKNFSNRIHQNLLQDSQTQNSQICSIENSQIPGVNNSQISFQFSSLREKTRRNNSEVYPPEIHSSLLTCGEITIMTCSHLNGAETIPQRFFIAGTLFFTIIIVGLYESTLLSAMRKPFEYPELHTLKDVLDTNFPIWTKYQNLKDNTFHDRKLKERVVIVDNNEVSLRNMIVENKSVLGIMRHSTADLEDRSEFYDENGEYLLHVIEECPAEYSLSYVVKRFSPYLERIDKILSRMSEAGFFLKWYDDMRYPIYKEEQRKLASRSLVSVLTLEHYSLSFFILLGAFLCSTLVFIAEIQFARSAKPKKYNKRDSREGNHNKT